MATSRVAVTEGSGKNLATHSFSEDAVTKEVSRVNLNTSAGVETGVAASPLQVSLANHGAKQHNTLGMPYGRALRMLRVLQQQRVQAHRHV